MKKIFTAKKYFPIFSVFTIALAFILGSCLQEETTDPASDPSLPESDSFLFSSTVNATHIKGTSPCPQEIAEIPVYCSRSSSCTADSAIIVQPHDGLNIKFENEQLSTPLKSNSGEGVALLVDFNCQVPESFTHTCKLEFFNKGNKVDEQELKINMTVK